MEAVEPTRRIIVRRGGLQQQRSSTWASFTPSWIQNGIQTLKQTVFGSADQPSQLENSESLLGKRSEPADDRDPGPTPKRVRRESPPNQVFLAQSNSMEPQPSSIRHLSPPEATEPLLHASTPTLPRTQAAPSHAASQGVRRSSPVAGRVLGQPPGPALTQNYLPNLGTPRRQRLGALPGERRPATATFASNNAIPPRAASQVGLGREYSFQGYRAVSSGQSSGTDTDRTSPSRQPVTRAKIASRAPSFGPIPARTPKSGHVFGKGRSTSPVKPTLDRPAGTGWASGIVRTERERIRVGSFANIPYETSRPPIRDYTKFALDPHVGIATQPQGVPRMPMYIDAPRPPSTSVMTNGPANRALNMLSEMSTHLANARASPSLAPFTTLEIPPVQTRRVKVPIPASRAVAANKQREVKDTIAALRAKAQAAPYSTVHPSVTPSRKVLSKRQEDEADNEEDMFEFVIEPFKKGKENTKPTPSPGLTSSPSSAVVIGSPIEEKKEKEKEQEKEKENTQQQTQETVAVTEPVIRASTPNIRVAGTLKFPTTSLAGGAPPSGIRVAPSFRPTRETQFRTHAPAARIGGRFTANVDDDEDADEGAPTKEELEKVAKIVPAINVPTGFKLSFGKGEGSSTAPALTSTSTSTSTSASTLPMKLLVEAAVQASPAPEFKAYTAPITLSASAPTIVFTAPTAAPSPQPTPATMARLKTSTPPTRDEEMESGSPIKESAPISTATPPTASPTSMPSFPVAPPPGEGDKSKAAAPKLFEFPASGSTEASKTSAFTFGAPSATTAPKAGVPALAPTSATSTAGFKFDLPTPTSATAEPPKSAFPFGITPTPVPTPVEPKPGSAPFTFGAPPQAAAAAAPSTIAAAATPSPDKRPGFPFVALASTTPAETPSKPPTLFSGTPGTVTPTNKPFTFNAPSGGAPSEADSSPIKADPVPGFPFTSTPAPTNPFAFRAPPGSNPSPDSRASTPAAPATGSFTFTLPGVTGVQPINNPFTAKPGMAANGTSIGLSFNNHSATAATPAKPFTFGAAPSTTPAGPPPSSLAPFQFAGPPPAHTAPTAQFGAFGARKKPVLQLDIDMDKDGATPPQEPTYSNPQFSFPAAAASNGAFGSAPPTAHPFGQTAPSSPFNAPQSATSFGAAPSSKAPFGQPSAVAGTGTSAGGFTFGAPASNVSTPVTGTFPNLRAQTSSPAASPFNPPAQLFGAPAPGTPTGFPSNLSEAGSDVGERRIKPLPKSRKPRTQSETRNALAKFHGRH